MNSSKIKQKKSYFWNSNEKSIWYEKWFFQISKELNQQKPIEICDWNKRLKITKIVLKLFEYRHWLAFELFHLCLVLTFNSRLKPYGKNNKLKFEKKYTWFSIDLVLNKQTHVIHSIMYAVLLMKIHKNMKIFFFGFVEMFWK